MCCHELSRIDTNGFEHDWKSASLHRALFSLLTHSNRIRANSTQFVKFVAKKEPAHVAGSVLRVALPDFDHEVDDHDVIGRFEL